MADFLQHLINGIAAGTIYALVALGYTMVYGVLKLINFAHGDVMMVGVYLGYATAFQLGPAQSSFVGILVIFLVSMGGCALLGLAIERFAYRPLREKPRLTALITAIGISFALSYGFQLDFGPLPGAAPRAFPEIIKPTEWMIIGDRDVVIWNWQVISLLIAIALMVGLQYLVFKSRFGRAMRAVSFDHPIG
jgi:branched-chain amino acid transport system permease protein